MRDFITFAPTGDEKKDNWTIEAIKSELIAIAEHQAGTKDITYEFRFIGALQNGRVGIEIKSRKRRKKKA